MHSKNQAFPMQHEDFGEKIGGARKDLWKERGLYAEDLESMNEREADKFVKKDNIWKKPDYGAMLDEGVPLGVVYYIKKARDALNASPQYQRGDSTPEKRLQGRRNILKPSGSCKGPFQRSAPWRTLCKPTTASLWGMGI